MKRYAGFTLIELMITVAIAAIVLTIGVPSFRDMILNNTRVAQVNEFVGALNMARSEAVKTGFRVVICRSSDGVSCATDVSGIWENGWLIFIDRNPNGLLDSAAPNNEELLKVQSKLPSNFTLRTTTTLTQWIAYGSNGFNEGNTGLGTETTFKLCDTRGVDQARFIVIKSTGRPNVREKNTSDTCP